MIVRDEAENLPHCLESVRGIFDEIVVVDTGSTDRTREIAREFGARVFHFPWVDDFAAARNESLSHATGDYAFWLDADDVVEPRQRGPLSALLDGLPAGGGAAYAFRIAMDRIGGGPPEFMPGEQLRLFPLGDGVRWRYRVHEQIAPSLRRVGIPIHATGLVVRHTGSRCPDHVAAGRERDRRIIARMLEEMPGDVYVTYLDARLRHDPAGLLEVIHSWTLDLGITLEFLEMCYMGCLEERGELGKFGIFLIRAAEQAR
jgi:glycosyltransferase involved in cell wall biosynthesis